mgnify:FL=1
MNYNIEELNHDNVSDYVKVNTKAWQETYKGIVNDSFLELINTPKEINKSIDRKKKDINKAFDKSYLLKVNNNYIGVFRVCKSKDINYQDIGELQALYLLNEVKHMGYGRILFEKACDEVKKMGFNSMIVGCLALNTNANNFYKHMGGVLVSSRDFTLPNQTLKENVYLFREI